MRKVLVGRRYRHFKGHEVEVLYVATHSETLDEYVVYKHLEKKNIWVRPSELFLSEVDHEKYPDVKQKWRFELVPEKDDM